MTNENQKRPSQETSSDHVPEVIDAEYVETSSRIDTITPRIQKRITLVPDKRGNKLLWIAIAVGIVSLLMMIHTWF